ncbi:hypothetical protein ABVK25_000173 [Lepraria finkii]|uniref:Uncharacterized protein n=1 Tax=Lepraria finkii TaxID=1340010 RepID=A0ABR4BPE4_9LECA
MPHNAVCHPKFQHPNPKSQLPQKTVLLCFVSLLLSSLPPPLNPQKLLLGTTAGLLLDELPKKLLPDGPPMYPLADPTSCGCKYCPWGLCCPCKLLAIYGAGIPVELCGLCTGAFGYAVTG